MNAASPPRSRFTVLFLAANPKDTRRVRLDEEVRAIDGALRAAEHRDHLDLVQHWAVRAGDVQELLLRHRPDVVHFSGHGDGEGQILLEDGTGNAKPADPAALANLFEMLRDNTRCVVLNACFTAPQAEVLAEHVDCVIGTSRAIGNVAATNFATAFYRAVGYGRDLETAFRLGCNQIHLGSLGEENTPQLIAHRVDPATVRLLPPPGQHAAPITPPRQHAAASVVVGQVPPLAAAYQPREEATSRVEDAFATLGHGDARIHTVLLGGDGGVGKTQLAAGAFARAAADTPLRVWVPAASPDALLAGYAAAGAAIGAPAADASDVGIRAAGFLQWLAGPGASHPWLVVLDDLGLTPTQMRDWWPPATPQGRTVVTTRRRDAAFDGHGRTRVSLTVYSPVEARAYLTDRITPYLGEDVPDEALDQAAELAADLGHLPVALAQASAVIIDTNSTCTAYRRRFADRSARLTDLFPEGAAADSYTRTVATTWSLAIEAADSLHPAGLARPAAQLAAVVDPAGVPLRLWTTSSARLHLDSHRAGLDAAPAVPPFSDADDGRAAVRALARLSILTITPGDTPTGVRIHALAQRAIRDTLTPAQLAEAVRTVASALLELWPPVENDPDLTAVLRANVAHLDDVDPAALWTPAPHSVLFKAGNSFGEARLAAQARDHYQRLAAKSADLLEADDPDGLIIRNNLATWQGEAGDPAGAVEALSVLIPHMERVLGPNHRDTLHARGSLARLLGQTGDAAGALEALADLLPRIELEMGPNHPQTLSARGNLARLRGMAGDPAGAAEAYVGLLTDMERVLGPDDHATLSARGNLATWRGAAGDPAGAAEAYAGLVADSQRLLGPDHADTLTARLNHAHWQWEAGDPAGAAEAYAGLLTDMERVLGSDHPLTSTARRDLAGCRAETGESAS